MLHPLNPILALLMLTCSLFSAAPQQDWHIVLPCQATPAEQTAARELKHFLERCYPERFTITNSPTSHHHTIYLGQSSRVSKLLGNLDFTTLKPDEIILRTVGNTLVLTGHATRGTLYAVYEFLEQACGVRFWTPADTLCPRHESFSLPKLDFRYAPVFTDRKINCEVQRFPQFSARMRINHDTYMRRYPPLTEAWGGCNRILGWVHSIRELMPVKRYAASHPEFYALMESGKRDLSHEAQLCMSNPTMRKALIQNMLNSLKKHPGTRVISLSQADSNRFCTCPACRDFIARHGNLSDLLMDLVNQAASAIQRIHPDVKVETLAYQFTRRPPKSIRPAPNVIIRLCSIECDFSEPLNAPDNQPFLKDLQGWQAFGNELYIWNYITNFTDFYRPQPNLYHLNLDLKLFAQNGVTSVMEQGFTRQGTGPETLGYADFQDLRTYLTCKLMWNPNLNPQAIIDEFLSGVYGPAAPFLMTYLDIIHKAPRKHPEAFVSCYSTSTNQWLEPNASSRPGRSWNKQSKQPATNNCTNSIGDCEFSVFQSI